MVKKLMKETSPAEALEQVGTVMPRIIKVLATAPLLQDPIQFSKLDIKDGFCRMVCAVGKEWNFAYGLTNHPESPTELVIPSDLQMGLTLSPCFFLVASYTSFDVEKSYHTNAFGHCWSIHLRETQYQNY